MVGSSESTSEIKEQLTYFVRELFMRREYYPWVKQLANRRTDRWYSLIVTLDETGADLSEIKNFGEEIYRNFVFDVTRSPTFEHSGEYMIGFTVAGRLWHTMIWHTPAPDNEN